MKTDPATRSLLLAIARAAIGAAVREVTHAPVADAPILHEERGAFVTLKYRGRLRGCVGRVDPDGPLSIMLPNVAVLSATADPRFARVSPAELESIHIEISLLTVPVLVTGPAEIRIGRHGLMVSARGCRGLLLPQVATEYGWSAEEFLSQTCVKAALSADAWKRGGVRIHAFETEIIAE
jgi:AmmeMemoRadiSam system protein A